MTNLTRANYAGKTRFQRKRLALEGTRSQIPSGTNVALVVALQGVDGIVIRATRLRGPSRTGLIALLTLATYSFFRVRQQAKGQNPTIAV